MVINESEWSREFARSTVRDALAQIIDDATPGLIERLATDPAAYAQLLAVTHLVAEEAEELLRETAISARHAGLNWEQVGAAIDLDRQAAQRRFGPKKAELAEPLEPDIPEQSAALGDQLTAPQLVPGHGQALTPGGHLAPIGGELAAVTSGQLAAYADGTQATPLLRPYPPLGTRDTVFEGDDNRWTFGTAGQYGWHPVSFSGSTWTVEFDNQQWEFDITTGKEPKGPGWQRIGRYAFAVYWTRPTGRPILPGNPDPGAFTSEKKLKMALAGQPDRSIGDRLESMFDIRNINITGITGVKAGF